MKYLPHYELSKHLWISVQAPLTEEGFPGHTHPSPCTLGSSDESCSTVQRLSNFAAQRNHLNSWKNYWCLSPTIGFSFNWPAVWPGHWDASKLTGSFEYSVKFRKHKHNCSDNSHVCSGPAWPQLPSSLGLGLLLNSLEPECIHCKCDELWEFMTDMVSVVNGIIYIIRLSHSDKCWW